MNNDRKKILICDDSLLVRTQLRDFINGLQRPIDVFEAQDGKQAVDMYVKHKPDLVFLDVVMPDQNGIECLKRIKEVDPVAKVVMLSSSGTKQILKDALAAGAADFVQKPWTGEVISGILAKFLG